MCVGYACNVQFKSLRLLTLAPCFFLLFLSIHSVVIFALVQQYVTFLTSRVITHSRLTVLQAKAVSGGSVWAFSDFDEITVYKH